MHMQFGYVYSLSLGGIALENACWHVGGDLQSKLLTVAEAKKRKAGIESQSRKQQKLLQAEQPKLIECSA